MLITEIKKGDKIKSNQLGVETSAVVMESIKQGKGFKKILLVDVKGSEVGLFDETGSIYTRQITKVFRDNNWLPVEHLPTKFNELNFEL
jgi:hypothetical protein